MRKAWKNDLICNIHMVPAVPWIYCRSIFLKFRCTSKQHTQSSRFQRCKNMLANAIYSIYFYEKTIGMLLRAIGEIKINIRLRQNLGLIKKAACIYNRNFLFLFDELFKKLSKVFSLTLFLLNNLFHTNHQRAVVRKVWGQTNTNC